MTPSEIDRITTQIRDAFCEASSFAQDGQRQLARIDNLEMPAGCKPTTTSMLLVLDPSQPKPLVYIAPGQLLANSRSPKNSGNVMVGGQTWMQFSFNIPWSDGDNIARFVVAARQRFAQNE